MSAKDSLLCRWRLHFFGRSHWSNESEWPCHVVETRFCHRCGAIKTKTRRW